MPALDFPASPTNGQVFGNWIYSTAKGAWQSKPLTPAKTVNSPTAPTSPADGDQWFNTNTGQLFIYYTDANGSQWVESRAPITADGYISPNYVINGGMDIWQRGTSFTTAGYTADRWNCFANDTVSRQSFSSGTEVPNAQYFFRIQSTQAGSVYHALQQTIENGASIFSGKTATVSFWMRSNTSNSFTVNVISLLTNDTEQGVGSTAINITTTWTKYTVTFTFPTTTQLGLHRYLRFVLPTNATGYGFDLANVQFEEGSVATPFRRNASSIQGELAACQRYYQRYSYTRGSLGAIPLLGSLGFAGSASEGYIVITPIVTLRTSVIANSQISFNALLFDNQVNYGSAITGVSVNTNGGDRQTATAVNLKLSGMTGLTAYQPYWICTNSTAGFIAFDVEL